MKKLVTVSWSYIIEADLPDGVGVEELEAFNSPPNVQEIASDIVQEASRNLHWKDGVITDISDMSE